MNRKLVLAVAIGLVATQLWAQDKAPKKIELKTTNDKAAYALGTVAAMDLAKSGDAGSTSTRKRSSADFATAWPGASWP